MNNPTKEEKRKALVKKLGEELTILDAELQYRVTNIQTLIKEIDLTTL